MSEIEYITVERALDALAEAVAEKGEDYEYAPPVEDPDEAQYGTCLYVYQGAPSCLVGHALVTLGVPLNVFQPWEGKEISEIADYVDWPIDDAAYNVLIAAQKAQDGGETWGQALVAARREATR